MILATLFIRFTCIIICSSVIRLTFGWSSTPTVLLLQESAYDIKESVKRLEDAARLPFTGIISNPHLAEETAADVIRSGHQQVLEYAEALQKAQK